MPAKGALAALHVGVGDVATLLRSNKKCLNMVWPSESDECCAANTHDATAAATHLDDAR